MEGPFKVHCFSGRRGFLRHVALRFKSCLSKTRIRHFIRVNHVLNTQLLDQSDYLARTSCSSAVQQKFAYLQKFNFKLPRAWNMLNLMMLCYSNVFHAQARSEKTIKLVTILHLYKSGLVNQIGIY